jgi:lysophospholipase L1-like esterase
MSTTLLAGEAESKWIAIGDSFTAGTGDDEGGWIHRTFVTSATRLKLADLVNLAVPYLKLDEIIATQLPRLRRARVVSVIAGANDILAHRVDLPEVSAKIHLLLDAALMHGDVVLSCTCPDFSAPRARPSTMLSNRIEAINGVLRARIATEPRLRVVDAKSLLNDLALWDEDKIHPNPRGHHELAELAVAELLR